MRKKDSLNPTFQMVDMDGVMRTSPRKKGDDKYYSECIVCNNGSNLLRCDTCPSVFHLECISPPPEHAHAGNWSCPDCNKKDELISLKDFKRSIKRNNLPLKPKEHSTMKKLDSSQKIISSSCAMIEQEKKVTEEKSRALPHRKVNGRVRNAIPQDDRYGLDKVERPKLCTITEAWSEEELDALWIGVRRHKAGNWDAMLVDPMLKCLQYRTSESLSKRWSIERQKVLHMEKSQARHSAAVKPLKSISEEIVPAGDYHQPKRPNGFLKIGKPQKLFGKSLVSTQSHQSTPLLGKKSQLGKRSREKHQYGGCRAEKGRKRKDDSATESEVSLKGWIEGNGASSEETVSD